MLEDGALKEDFQIELLGEYVKEECLVRETELSKTSLFPKGLNGNAGRYIEMTEEVKKIIGNKNRGKLRSEQHKIMVSQMFRGKNLTDSHKNKIKLSLTGKKKTEEHKKHISDSHYDASGTGNPMFGKTHSERTIKKMSDIKTGKNNPCYGIRFQWITDGQSNKRIDKNESIPPGFKKGKSQKKII